jgi:hypothetical protein
MTSNRPFFASLPRDLYDDATCTIHRHFFTKFEVKLGNPSPTCFTMKQAVGCRRVSPHRLHLVIGFEAQIDKPPPLDFGGWTKKLAWWFWGTNHQIIDLSFEAQTKKPSQRFWCQTTDKPSPPILRLNWKTCASHLLHVYDADHTRRHPTSRWSGHRVPDPTLASILIVVRHVVFTTCTSWDNQPRFSKPNNSIWG